MATARLAELVAVYQQQLAGYHAMLALAEEQKNCVRESNYPVLVEILERRDRIAAEITASSAQVRLLCQLVSEDLGLEEVNLTSLKGKLPEQVLSPLTNVLADITEIIQRIQATDQESEAQLKQVLDLLRGQMGEVQRGQVALRAYKQAPTVRDARLVDKQR